MVFSQWKGENLTWYDNPTLAAVLGAVIGAVITTAVSLFIWFKTQKTKKIDCLVHDVSSLLSVSEKIQDQLEVSYSGKTAESVYFISIELISSGTEAVSNQPVHIRLERNSTIIDYSVKTHPQVGFGAIEEFNHKNNELDIMIELLNPGDRVSFEIVSIDNKDESVMIYLKNENVQTRVLSMQNKEQMLTTDLSDRNMMLLGFLSSIPIFGGLAWSMINITFAKRKKNIKQ